MSTRVIMKHFRTVVSLLAIIAAGSAVLMPGIVRGQNPDDCYYDDGTDEWACARTPHVYQQQCEGTDCYSGQEFCCVMIE